MLSSTKYCRQNKIYYQWFCKLSQRLRHYNKIWRQMILEIWTIDLQTRIPVFTPKRSVLSISEKCKRMRSTKETLPPLCLPYISHPLPYQNIETGITKQSVWQRGGILFVLTYAFLLFLKWRIVLEPPVQNLLRSVSFSIRITEFDTDKSSLESSMKEKKCIFFIRGYHWMIKWSFTNQTVNRLNSRDPKP